MTRETIDAVHEIILINPRATYLQIPHFLGLSPPQVVSMNQAPRAVTWVTLHGTPNLTSCKAALPG